jgi:hypothetical protein
VFAMQLHGALGSMFDVTERHLWWDVRTRTLTKGTSRRDDPDLEVARSNGADG